MSSLRYAGRVLIASQPAVSRGWFVTDDPLSGHTLLIVSMAEVLKRRVVTVSDARWQARRTASYKPSS
jgi:hypothetical protein